MDHQEDNEFAGSADVASRATARGGEFTRILALETSGRDASIAAIVATWTDVRLLREVVLGGQQRTAQVLAPAVRDLFESVAWKPNDVQLVAVAVGPGSFTGLRIGVTMAKTFAYAIGAEVIGVNTLEVLAAQAGNVPQPLWSIMDAQRQELFAAKFDRSNGRLQSDEVRIIAETDWLATLQPGDCVTGPALLKLQSRLPDGLMTAEASRWNPLASTVGHLGWRDYAGGRRDDVWKLAPHYYRLSAAEEKKSAGG